MKSRLGRFGCWDQRRQNGAGPIFPLADRKCAPGARRIRAAINITRRPCPACGDAYAEQRAIRVPGDVTEQQIAGCIGIARHGNRFPVQPAIAAAPKWEVPAGRVIRRLKRHQQVGGKRIAVERRDRGGWEIVGKRLPGDAAIAAAIKRIGTLKRARFTPLRLVVRRFTPRRWPQPVPFHPQMPLHPRYPRRASQWMPARRDVLASAPIARGARKERTVQRGSTPRCAVTQMPCSVPRSSILQLNAGASRSIRSGPRCTSQG